MQGELLFTIGYPRIKDFYMLVFIKDFYMLVYAARATIVALPMLFTAKTTAAWNEVYDIYVNSHQYQSSIGASKAYKEDVWLYKNTHSYTTIAKK